MIVGMEVPLSCCGSRLAAVLIVLGLVACSEDPALRVPVPPSDGEVRPDVTTRDTGADAAPATTLLLTAAKPDHGPFVGGTRVVLTGANFDKKVKVHFGGRAVQPNQLTFLSPMKLAVVTPAGKAGLTDVEVTRTGEVAVLKNGFRYDKIYTVPSSGPTVGGTLVTVHGQDTTFKAGMKLQLEGKDMVDVDVVSATLLRAKTPPGSLGPADLTAGLASGDLMVRGAYSYYYSTSPTYGGMGGGPVAGTVTVTVLDEKSRVPIESARVVLQQARAMTLSAHTNKLGVVVFAHPKLKGPLTVTAGKKEYETASFVSFDARDVTIFLLPYVKPSPGPMPPGSLPGTISGHVVFGGPTGVGNKEWKLVPEPKAGQVKRTYVVTTVPRITWSVPAIQATATIDYKNSGAKAWPFTMTTRTGVMAVYALAGIHTTATGAFQPYALGVTRGVVVGPGEKVKLEVRVFVPLIRKVRVRFKDLPPELKRYQVRLAVDLGAEGLMLRADHLNFGEGKLSEITFGGLPHFVYKGLLDASFTAHLELDAPSAAGFPLIRATEASVQPDKADVITVDKIVGAPRALEPQKGGTLQGNTLRWSYPGARASLAEMRLYHNDKTPVWRILVNGAVTEVKLPDPATAGLPAWPSGTYVWYQYLAHLPSYSFNTFNYLHVYSVFWDRWAADRSTLKIP